MRNGLWLGISSPVSTPRYLPRTLPHRGENASMKFSQGPLRLDAALYEPAAPRKPGQIGRPRLKGSRLANLSVVAKDPKTTWMPITVSYWYGGGERTVEIVSNIAIWYTTGLPAVPLR